jgi:FkbM family methyltransferase
MESAKTRFLNSIRKLYANSFGERILLPFSRNSSTDDFIGKLTPMPNLYLPGSHRQVVRNGLRFDLDISDMVDWYVYFSWRDAAWDALFGLMKEGQVVFDVGTNIGYTLLRAAQCVGPTGKVFGFEPAHRNYSKCLKNLELNGLPNVEVQKLALGNTNGPQRLVITDEHNTGMNRLAGDQESGESVEVIKLDDWVIQNSITHIDVIKIDVEGFELNVLKGGYAAIQQHKPALFIEINDSYLRHFGASVQEIFLLLVSQGYNLYDIFFRKISPVDKAEFFHSDIIALHKTKD